MDRWNLHLLVLATLLVVLAVPDAAFTAGDTMDRTRLLTKTVSVSRMSEDVVGLQNEGEVRRRLQEYERQLKLAPDNHAVLLQAAYLQYRLGWLFVGKKERKDCYFRFFHFAQKAYELAPRDYRSLLLLAVAKAKIIEYLSNGEQVRLARELDRDVQELLLLGGDDPDAIYLASWLNFEIGRISFINRMLAATLFGGLPEGLSVDKAFDLMHKAIEARPEYIVYQYDLGFYYLRTGSREKARRQFEWVLARRADTVEDIVYQRKAAGKMSDLGESANTYR